ncbi:PLP-dependent aminotransferase family protein [Geothermobacter hydrogeniphilus]|uniref:PLP-dependent aminotransferase family protein n=1 Tax=Geothermobacter hydrogeniphilus TaxID=1969733 RepID=A0A2K2HBZ4_9BACT|nr:PLP-dependent aminotransferase family protein [Geothermobacter hydrogeniphilus]PNU20770.1 PLP-dependent aminotransferase family protein [Geothermobacter hydrogeniphilus]
MFFLDSNAPVPLFKQLYNQMREHILLGSLPADSKLPSVRDMANNLAVSRNTVDGAYQELFAEGYIYSKPRSGYFVSPLDQESAPRSLVSKPDNQAPPLQRAPTYRYDFHPARLDPESFPNRLWRKFFLECLRENPQQLSEYCDPQGELGLRFAIQNYLERSRGVVCDPEQIVVTAGLQHSLDIVANVLKEDHSRVAVEDPGYPLASTVFRNHSYKINPVPVRPDGIDLDALKAGNSSIAYVTPSHQLPMGYVIPVANRLNLIEWAEAGDKFILEDDYDSELRYSSKPIPSLQGLRPHGNIIYMGTFSKVLSPALRVSYIVLPRSLLARYYRLFQNHFSSVSQLEQRTLAKFMVQGYWNRHIRRMRSIYKKKHDTTLRAIKEHFGTLAVVDGQGAGLHVVLQLLGATCGETEIIRRAEQKGIRLLPFSWTCASGKSVPVRLMLGFGGMTEIEIKEGIALLAQACH